MYLPQEPIIPINEDSLLSENSSQQTELMPAKIAGMKYY